MSYNDRRQWTAIYPWDDGGMHESSIGNKNGKYRKTTGGFLHKTALSRSRFLLFFSRFLLWIYTHGLDRKHLRTTQHQLAALISFASPSHFNLLTEGCISVSRFPIGQFCCLLFFSFFFSVKLVRKMAERESGDYERRAIGPLIRIRGGHLKAEDCPGSARHQLSPPWCMFGGGGSGVSCANYSLLPAVQWNGDTCEGKSMMKSTTTKKAFIVWRFGVIQDWRMCMWWPLWWYCDLLLLSSQ